MANKNHDAWEKIFEVKALDTAASVHVITADEIKLITGREPRLVAKIDSSKDLPLVLSKNGYFPLPIGKGTYAIVKGEGFHELENSTDIKNFTSRIQFNLDAMGSSTSEMQYLDYSHSAGLIEDLIGRGTLYPIIRGRTRSGAFSFKVGLVPISVDGAQIEVDLGLEGEDCIILLEGKSKSPADFIIRQLYYPYRKYKNISPGKEIIPIFFTYDNRNRSYNYWIYKFRDIDNYNSLQLVSQSSYNINVIDQIDTSDIYPVGTVYKDIIPQADDLDKVQELIFKIKEGINSAASVADYFKFNVRQSSYYREAAQALGFVGLTNNRYNLTESGQYFTSLDIQDRNLYFSRVISNFTIMRIALEDLKTKGTISESDFEKIITDHSSLTGTTVSRRAQTMKAWFRWLASRTGAVIIDKDGTIRSS